VSRGQQLGAVYRRTDGNAPSHLHFEIRDFLFNDRVNGSAPENGVTCGFQCAPGPGYWPVSSPNHPSDLGWRNPMHVIASTWHDVATSRTAKAIATASLSAIVPLYASPGSENAEVRGEIVMQVGEPYTLLDVQAGDAAGTAFGAEQYDVWFEIESASGVSGWVSALRPTFEETGSDGSPSSLRWIFLLESHAK
jgi:hypothetical protein